jgi:uncharacterized protein (TIGR03435 family)
MLKQLLPALSAAILAAGALFAQTPAPAFEVATVKLASQLTPDLILSGKMRVGMRTDAGRVEIGFMSLKDLIQLAYEVKPFQVSGPDWMTAQRFDVVAKLPDGATKEQVPRMLQALLAERFGLAVRRDNKEVPVYALMVGKGGSKLKESPKEPAADPQAFPPAKPQGGIVIGAGDQQLVVKQNGNGATIAGGKDGAMRVSMGPGGTMRMEAEKMTMARLAETLTPMLDRPVVDRTGLNGTYQVALELAMQDMMQAASRMGVGVPGAIPRPDVGGAAIPAASDPSGGSIFNSVQQLGLRLEKDKAPFETIVVDRLEKNPTDN